jgi:hypothetical protein
MLNGVVGNHNILKQAIVVELHKIQANLFRQIWTTSHGRSKKWITDAIGMEWIIIMTTILCISRRQKSDQTRVSKLLDRIKFISLTVARTLPYVQYNLIVADTDSR